jgi:hypothetical protein
VSEKKKKLRKKKTKKFIGQMFLSTENTRVVQANKDNIEYYNKIYEESKSEESKQAALDLAVFIKNN